MDANDVLRKPKGTGIAEAYEASGNALRQHELFPQMSVSSGNSPRPDVTKGEFNCLAPRNEELNF
jgi:hypothetical protein